MEISAEKTKLMKNNISGSTLKKTNEQTNQSSNLEAKAPKEGAETVSGGRVFQSLAVLTTHVGFRSTELSSALAAESTVTHFVVRQFIVIQR